MNAHAASDGKNLLVSDACVLSIRMTTYHCVESDQVRSLNHQWNHHLIFASSTLGESPPPAPRACFGRDELIEEIVGLAENLTPTALIGAGGIGKTSIALTVLHHDRIKRRFGDNRRFIRCDKFPPSCAHFLNHLSKAIGADIENPKDLGPLRPFLSSREMSIVLDNAESILDPRGTDSREIRAVVEELSRFKTVWLCITSRITTVPPHCKRPVIPTLAIEAACDIFYEIYDGGERSDIISDLLRRLDFHALSISLLATIAVYSAWDYDRLAKEWDRHRTQVLRTDCDESLAATIELSLASPTFRELGPDARDLLGVVAFFPQGINENNVDWLFPTISDGAKMFDKFCTLSLTYRTHGFVTMLAPIRDYLSPRDPKSSSLLCTTKEQYFARMAVVIDVNGPSFGESRWITSEDVNVEHLLDVFTTIDANSDSIWEACANFMRHLLWHKKRLVILKPKIEGLPDDHRSKPECLFELSRLFGTVGNWVECKRLLTLALKLERERGNDSNVARALRNLSNSNWQMCLNEEGIEQIKEASRISERLGDTVGQAQCLIRLAQLLCEDNRFEAAEEAALCAINLFSEKGDQFKLCQSHRTLGEIYRSKGEPKKAIHHFEIALRIAVHFDWHTQLFWTHYALAWLFGDQGRFEDANAHIECAKSHTIDSAYNLGGATKIQAIIWYKQHRLEEARSEALRAIDVYEKAGATEHTEICRWLLWDIKKKLDTPVASGQ